MELKELQRSKITEAMRKAAPVAPEPPFAAAPPAVASTTAGCAAARAVSPGLAGKSLHAHGPVALGYMVTSNLQKHFCCRLFVLDV